MTAPLQTLSGPPISPAFGLLLGCLWGSEEAAELRLFANPTPQYAASECTEDSARQDGPTSRIAHFMRHL
jgi:hypothetical protein